MATNQYNSGTDSTQGANNVVLFYDRKGIKAANAVNKYGQFASKKRQPRKEGKEYRISKYLKMYDRTLNDGEFATKGYLTARSVQAVSDELASSVALGEGAGAVNKKSIEKITMTATLARYGEMLDYSDEVELFSEDDMQVRYRMDLGDLANQRQEDLIQLDMLSTGTVSYSGVATSKATVADKVSYTTIQNAVRKLVRNRAKKNTTMVTGSTKIDTKTIAAAYYAIIGADVKADLENLTRGTDGAKEFAYRELHEYGDATKAADGEVGAMKETRFIESESAMVYVGEGAPYSETATSGTYTDDTTIKTTTFADAAAVVAARGSVAGEKAGVVAEYADGAAVTADGATAILEYADVFPILYPTQDSFATIGLKGKDKITFIAKSPMEAVSTINPYATQGFFSYNMFYAGIILEEEKLLKVLTAASN